MAILDSSASRVAGDLNAITAPWKHSVDFEVSVGIVGEHAVARVTTSDKVFHFLNEGTRKRYALMSGNWKSKTKPGRMKSGAGAGKVLYIGKRKPWKNSRKRWPRPGIKARKWMPEAQLKETKTIQRKLVNTVKETVKLK